LKTGLTLLISKNKTTPQVDSIVKYDAEDCPTFIYEQYYHVHSFDAKVKY